MGGGDNRCRGGEHPNFISIFDVIGLEQVTMGTYPRKMNQVAFDVIDHALCHHQLDNIVTINEGLGYYDLEIMTGAEVEPGLANRNLVGS